MERGPCHNDQLLNGFSTIFQYQKTRLNAFFFGHLLTTCQLYLVVLPLGSAMLCSLLSTYWNFTGNKLVTKLILFTVLSVRFEVGVPFC